MSPSPSEIDRENGAIDWPEFATRTPSADREQTFKFGLQLDEAIDRLEEELVERIDVDDWRLSTAAPHRDEDGRPYENVDPDDPGVVVRWRTDDDRFCVACDRYDHRRDNLQSILGWLREVQKAARRPVETLGGAFTPARMPQGSGEERSQT